MRLSIVLLACALLIGCEKKEGDACEPTDDCAAGLACLNGTCRSCDKSDRCQSYGMCRAAGGRCEVPADRTDDCNKRIGREKYAPCDQDGKCAVEHGVCWAKADEDCKNSAGCKESGACTARDGRCVPAKDEDCHGSKVCVELAHCTVKDGRCALTSSADCAKHKGCLAKGLCTLRDKSCIVNSSDDCKASSMCKIHGACTARNGACQP